MRGSKENQQEDMISVSAPSRFLENDRFDEADILSVHFSATSARVEKIEGPLFILHDTSEFIYSRTGVEIGKIGKMRRNPAADMIGGKKYFTQCGVHMADREGDMYEFFHEASEAKRHFLM